MAQNIRVLYKNTLFTFLVIALFPLAQSEDWSSTNFQFLSGKEYELSSRREQEIITIEHAGGFKYGDIFFFYDTTNPTEDGTSVYGEFSPRLNIGRVFQQDLSVGPITDFYVAGTLEMGNNVRTYLYGLGMDIKIPYFAFFNLQFYIRDDQRIENDSTWQITAAWLLPFETAMLKWTFGGFLDWAGAEGTTGKSNILTAPQLLLDVSHFWGKSGHLFAGIEYQYWKNKFGVNAVNESVPQYMIKLVF